jgi:hypothetical protein
LRRSENAAAAAAAAASSTFGFRVYIHLLLFIQVVVDLRPLILAVTIVCRDFRLPLSDGAGVQSGFDELRSKDVG